MSNNIAGVKVESTYSRKPKDSHFIMFTFPKLLLRDNRIHFLSMDSQIQKGLLSLPRAFSCQRCSCQTQSLSAWLLGTYNTVSTQRPQPELGFQFTGSCVDMKKDRLHLVSKQRKIASAWLKQCRYHLLYPKPVPDTWNNTVIL